MMSCSASPTSPEMPAQLLVKLFVILLGVVSAAVFVVDAHHVNEDNSTKDFTSIDCGYSGDNYNDEQTKIPYTSDDQYIATGETHNVSFSDASLPRRLQTLRSFPGPAPPRNCYTLGPVVAKQPYLLRATFLHGDYDGSLSSGAAPVKFDLYIDVNLCKTLNITDPSTAYVVEVIAVTLEDDISACLVNTNSGTPFISALELRPVEDTVLYDYLNQTQYLVLFLRLDLGTTTNEVIRYPQDRFDRLWDPQSTWSDKLSFRPSSLTDITTTNEILEDPEDEDEFETPEAVLETAAAPANSAVLEFSWDFAGSGAPANAFFVFLHFAELQLNTSRVFDIYLNGAVLYKNVTTHYLTPDSRPKGEKTPVPLPASPRYQWALNSTGLSQLPPILNALEVYTQMELTNTLTYSPDVNAITAIKNGYHLIKNWMGDPCTPRQYAWLGLNCSYNSGLTRIISINLSSSALNGSISSSFASLGELESLDLSDNSLTGQIPDELGNLPSLRYLNLTGNDLTGDIPASLREKKEQGKLTFEFEGNSGLCTSVTPCGKSKKLATPVIVVLCSVSVLLLLVVAFMVWRLRKSQVNFSKLLKGRRNNPLLESRQFTYKELETITDSFKNGIGKGGFGAVYHGRLEDGSQVAVKLRSQSSSQGTKEFLAEAQNLTRIHHKNLVSLVGYCMDGDHLALVYEFMPMGTLQDHLRDKTRSGGALSWGQRLRIAVDAAQGLEYLHKGCKPPLVHRDVKTSNILLSENLEAKIADFGLSKAFQNDADSHVSTTSVVGTPGYLDPEYYFNYQLSERSDIYSFGVVLLELITGQSPVLKVPQNISLIQWAQQSLAEGNIEGVVDPNLQGQYDVNSIWKAADVAFRCTSQISNQRPTMTDVVVELKEGLALETMRGRSEFTYASKNIESQTSVHGEEYFPEIAPSAR